MRLPRTVLVSMCLTAAVPSLALAKKKKPSAPAASAEQLRSMNDLAGKFKWGMSHDEVFKVLEDTIHARYKDLFAKETDLNRQDDLRKKELEDIKKTKDSYTIFDGTKHGGWDVSIIDKEFAQRNNESMVVMWEKDQRRFLFFWNDKLYKQFIAFDAEHPVFKGKSFDDFVKLLEERYGPSEMKFAQMKTKEDMVVDHIEWPPRGNMELWAIDQSGFYGNYCLRVCDPKVEAEIEKVRLEKSPKRANGNALIDAVTKPDAVEGDKNADIVDDVVGRKSQKTNQGAAPTTTKKKADEKKDDGLDGMKF